ncbi:hypothetical protein P9139_12750 [Curtobacterium flaccumfaciens]|nr:hypothetical protein P9139_12750 [Curtobacterium flaccumfaciens]
MSGTAPTSGADRASGAATTSGTATTSGAATAPADVAMLVIGEPDVPVAPHIGEAARRAWSEDRTDYTPNGGIAPLREAIRESFAARTASRRTSNRSG